MQTKNDVIEGAGYLGKKDTSRGKLTALQCHPTKKVNSAEELTYVSISI
jgi:hypothetical protein